MQYNLNLLIERYPIAGKFTISRGSKTEAVIVVCELSDGIFTGRGECVPYARFGESIESVSEQIRAVASLLNTGGSAEELRLKLQNMMPAGAARNAVDCALWDLQAKQAGSSVASLLKLTARPLITAITVSIDTPELMAAATAKLAHHPLIKVKIGGDNDSARIRAVRGAAPEAQIILDANEGWNAQNFDENMGVAASCAIALIEQPLPSSDDSYLLHAQRPVPVCADESAHTSEGLEKLTDRYDAVNIKLDKTGGLTEALIMRDKARILGLKVMVGCMVGSSLAMAPALMVGQDADFIDLDGPLLLAKDREPALHYDGTTVSPPLAELWG
ncbi:N-acetyl-D-Glu racemase DgcA [Pseudochrobactrum sp. MP213Fo]|uniref:N-acetyl-D-Glu racemase DgcA n=1 Tax=Pseudochrobactrum sp. MP213Fo TaxID=3022250 RepID=UPI003BA1FB16